MFQEEQVVEGSVCPEVSGTETYLQFVLFAGKAVVRRFVVRRDGTSHHGVILFPQLVTVQAGKRFTRESVLQIVRYPLSNADDSSFDFAVRFDLHISHVGMRKVCCNVCAYLLERR